MENKKYYLNEEGVRLLVRNFDKQLSGKMNKTEMSNYPKKEDLNIYATEDYVDQKIATIITNTQYDNTIAERVESLEEKIMEACHFKGEVSNKIALEEIENPEIGDIYNINDTGINVIWTGDRWDEFNFTIDLNQYMLIDDIQEITIEELNNIFYSGKTAVVSDLLSLQIMLDNNYEDIEVTLNADLILGNTILEIPKDKTVTINLDNNNINGTGEYTIKILGGNLILRGGSVEGVNRTIYVADGGSLFINNTDVLSTSSNAINAKDPDTIVEINGGNITAQEYGVNIMHGASVIVNNGYLKGLDNFALGGNGSEYIDGARTIKQLPINATINGGIIEGNIITPGYIATAIYWPNAGILNINGGVVRASGAGIVQRAGIINLNSGATIISTGDSGTTGKAGDSRVVVGSYAVVFDKSANYPNNTSMTLNIAKGATLQGTAGDIQRLPIDTAGIIDNR